MTKDERKAALAELRKLAHARPKVEAKAREAGKALAELDARADALMRSLFGYVARPALPALPEINWSAPLPAEGLAYPRYDGHGNAEYPAPAQGDA